MKKSTIWLIAITMGILFLSLLYIQTRYFQETLRSRREQFDENVKRSLWMAAHRLEMDETRAILQKELADSGDATWLADDSLTYWPKDISTLPGNSGSQLGLQQSGKKQLEMQKQQSEMIEKYLHQKNLLERVIFSSLYINTEKPLSERVQKLDSYLKTELIRSGININEIPYHYYVCDSEGDTVTICSDYSNKGRQYAYQQELFGNGPTDLEGTLYVHFPKLQRYLFANVRFFVPAIVFTLFLLIVFIFTIGIIFRQKKLSEMKNDFINNMTHELKTPISTISLAGQMLNDKSLMKSEPMFNHVSRIITDETNRLRFQVEKVLQMSMFDEKGGTFRQEELNLHALIDNVVDTFRLKVESIKGTIETTLKATDSVILGDELHLTNVLFNLLENAMKYRDTSRELALSISTVNKGSNIVVSISDNGIGIKSDDLKRIFEKFYRSHTGNRHDVKGFGLGLAYVKKVIDVHKGHISVSSTEGKGSCFTFSLPLMK